MVKLSDKPVTPLYLKFSMPYSSRLDFEAKGGELTSKRSTLDNIQQNPTYVYNSI